MGREGPDRLVSCVALLEPLEDRAAAPEPEAAPRNESPPDAAGANPPRTLMKLYVDSGHLLSRLARNGAAYIANVPQNAYVVGCEIDPTRDGILLTLHSKAFPPVAEGAPIPELPAHHEHGD
jgi:hypothetical protein